MFFAFKVPVLTYTCFNYFRLVCWSYTHLSEGSFDLSTFGLNYFLPTEIDFLCALARGWILLLFTGNLVIWHDLTQCLASRGDTRSVSLMTDCLS